MIDIIKSEFQKSKRTSINKFVIITPILTLILSFLLGDVQNDYNWWYIMFLPGMLSIISSQVITREEKISYKGLFLYPQDKGTMWVGKIIYLNILLIITSLIFMVGIICFSFIYVNPTISLNNNIWATLILIMTFSFQIPISLFLTVKFNMFISVIFNVAMTFLGALSFGTNLFKVLYPYGISSALMVPILHVLPNGLQVAENSMLPEVNITVGILINVVVFIIITTITTLWFRNKEVN